ncbi:DUF4861 domain-containing protein [Bacteroides sp. OttesenSCG-928-J23]|nr:DUF4861 domain-containing protein [Bacteroides sp. OttesenSCG-928-J23]
MKKILFLLVATFFFMACQEKKVVTVTVTNPIALDRNNEMVEMPVVEISKLLELPADGQMVVKDARGTEVPYQITHDQLLIFQANVMANSAAQYTIEEGTPQEVVAIAVGRHYPERVDDIAWENDLVAFRTYGPALQANGERAFGYDTWTKRATNLPVVEERYRMDLDPAIRKSYHADHGNGLDCYKVGPTLGAGTAALLDGEQIVYPWAYKTYEILDNGPLRFKVKLEYNPLTVKSDTNVIETRIISLDTGSHLNKTVISYTGLSNVVPVATGIVLHDDAEITADAAKGFITYVDPTDNPRVDNGKIFIGAAFPGVVKEAKAVYFDEKESKEQRGGANGHVLAISDYAPGIEYTYYWGSAWSKAGMDLASWNTYMGDYAQKVRNPLTVEIR